MTLIRFLIFVSSFPPYPRPSPFSLSSLFFNSSTLLQITRNGVITEGRLAYNLTEGPSANPRWLVKFDLEQWKDEELYEASFGALLRKAGNDEDRMTPENYPNKQSIKRTNASTSGSSEDEEAKSNGNNNKKNVTFSAESSLVASDSSSSPPSNENNEHAGDNQATKRAKAREERIARRQAKVEEKGQPNKRKAGDRGKDSGSNKRSRVVDANHSDEEVITVQMRTGTLYLYRGLHRRAEFVRKL